MVKIYLNVFGMKCGMCEAHVNDIVRKTIKVKKVKSSHKKNETIITKENEYDVDSIIKAINSLGYDCSLNRIEDCNK